VRTHRVHERKALVMKRTLTGLAVAGIVALGLAIPSSAAPSLSPSAGDAAGRPAVGDEPAKLLQRHDASDTRRAQVPPKVEGIAGGFVYVPITPYRTVDSRSYAEGFMVGGDEVYFTVLTDENNVPRVPNTAVAVTYNLTVDGTVGAGYCALFPGSANWPGNSSINWTASRQTIANGGTVAIDFFDAFGQVSVFCGPGVTAGTDFILDITGYYI
jgi:hypothetical protein